MNRKLENSLNFVWNLFIRCVLLIFACSHSTVIGSDQKRVVSSFLSSLSFFNDLTFYKLTLFISLNRNNGSRRKKHTDRKTSTATTNDTCHRLNILLVHITHQMQIWSIKKFNLIIFLCLKWIQVYITTCLYRSLRLKEKLCLSWFPPSLKSDDSFVFL